VLQLAEATADTTQGTHFGVSTRDSLGTDAFSIGQLVSCPSSGLVCPWLELLSLL
jgi:hypothetical protein